MNPNQPDALDELIVQLQGHSNRKDFSDDYLIENGNELGRIGEFMYGVSMVPSAWILPYLYELQELKKDRKNE